MWGQVRGSCARQRALGCLQVQVPQEDPGKAGKGRRKGWLSPKIFGQT